MGGDGGSRVSISADLVKTIQNIRDMTGTQYSDEDILSVFKDCLNDPHETAQKLMYIDTFQEVRSKRERKKENLVPKTQERGWYGRRNFASNYRDANNGRGAGSKRQAGGARTTVPAPNTAPNSIKAPNPISPPSVVGNHETQDVNKGVTAEQPLAKSTSSTENGVALEKSKASVVKVVVPVSDSNCSGQSIQATRTEAAAGKGKNQSLLQSDIGERQHVTFPAHLQAAKVLENGLSFGSFGSNVVKEASSDNCTNGCDESNIESSHGTAADVASAREEISQDKDDEMSNSAPKAEEALQSDQALQTVEGSVGDKLAEEFSSITETHQAANFDGTPIPYPDQSTIAASQQAMHLLRQQYPPHMFPYGPYFPPFYMPPQQYMPQYMSPNGFQQQSYLPPGDDAPTPPGPEHSLPHITPGSNIGNSPPTTIPSPYDSYAVAFNNTVNSAHKDGKEENIYTNGRLSLANLQASHMYNLSRQGQPLAFPTVQPGFPGMYQQTQPILPAAAISATTESIGLPCVPNQQPQTALTDLDNNYFVKQSN